MHSWGWPKRGGENLQPNPQFGHQFQFKQKGDRRLGNRGVLRNINCQKTSVPIKKEKCLWPFYKAKGIFYTTTQILAIHLGFFAFSGLVLQLAAGYDGNFYPAVQLAARSGGVV